MGEIEHEKTIDFLEQKQSRATALALGLQANEKESDA